MKESIKKVVEKIKSIFGDSIFYENNRRQLISAVKDFAEDFEDEEFLENAINSDDYKNGKSILLKKNFDKKNDTDFTYDNDDTYEDILKETNAFLKQKNLKLSQTDIQSIAKEVLKNKQKNIKSNEPDFGTNFAGNNTKKNEWKCLDDESVNDVLGKNNFNKEDSQEKSHFGCLFFLVLFSILFSYCMSH